MRATAKDRTPVAIGITNVNVLGLEGPGWSIINTATGVATLWIFGMKIIEIATSGGQSAAMFANAVVNSDGSATLTTRDLAGAAANVSFNLIARAIPS